MYYVTERNERRSRRSALVLAIALHLGLAAALFMAATQSPEQSTAPTPVKKIERPAPKAFDPRTASNQP